jgi:hypothetical protein
MFSEIDHKYCHVSIWVSKRMTKISQKPKRIQMAILNERSPLLTYVKESGIFEILFYIYAWFCLFYGLALHFWRSLYFFVPTEVVMATMLKRRQNKASILTSFLISKRNEPAYSRSRKDQSEANLAYSTSYKDRSEANSVYSINSKDRSGVKSVYSTNWTDRSEA